MATSTTYVRVSSRGQTHATQLPDLERWTAAHDGACKWFKDTFTGKAKNRFGIEKLIAQPRACRLERIVAWRLDRLGRTTKGLCELFDELQKRQVKLVSLKDGFSWASLDGQQA